MPAHVSVATAIEKNRIASAVAFVLLIDVFVLNPDGSPAETLSMARNTEAVTYNGTVYQPANFSVTLDLDAQSEPKFTVQAEDPSGFIRAMMTQYGGGVGFATQLTVVNTGNLDQAPEIQETFEITQASQQGYTVNFTMGVESPVSLRFPYRLQWQNQCPFLYKGARCGYVGDLPTCDFTYNGANGCTVHDNAPNFGGFLGLNNTNQAS